MNRTRICGRCLQHPVRRQLAQNGTSTPTLAAKPFEQIPGPKGILQWPIIGIALQLKPFTDFGIRNFEYRARAWNEEFGNICKVRLGLDWTVLVFDPEDVRKVARHEGKFPNALELPLLTTYNQRKNRETSMAERENKNKYFLGMMAYLVKQQFLREVWISFLLVGHTHEDIDQCFSRISVKLKSSNTITIPELHHIISESQAPKPKSVDVGTVWNISAWLENKVNPVHNVTFPKMYRIFCDDTGHVTVKYKERSTDEEWHPSLQEKPLEIFKVVDGEQQLPMGQPEKVQHRLDNNDVSDLKRSVKKDFQLAQFTEEHIETWNTFFSELGSLDVEEEWPLKDLRKYKNFRMESSLTVKEQHLIEQYQEKREEFRQVYTAKSQDRRSYREGEMLLYKSDMDGGAFVGEVMKCNSVSVHIRKYKTERGQKFVKTDEILDVSIDRCYAGGFHLTPGGFLPLKVKDRKKRENIIIN